MIEAKKKQAHFVKGGLVATKKKRPPKPDDAAASSSSPSAAVTPLEKKREEKVDQGVKRPREDVEEDVAPPKEKKQKLASEPSIAMVEMDEEDHGDNTTEKLVNKAPKRLCEFPLILFRFDIL